MIKLIQYFISKMNTLKITFITLFFLLSSGNIISKDKSNKPRKLFFPNIDGYQTLISDLHQHTIFSDGLVWPTIRVDEAIYDGVDVISMTEHLEYQPHKEDIPNKDRNRAYHLTKSYADNLNKRKKDDKELIVINGQEITKSMPPGHINAVFINEANNLLHEDSLTGILEANKQGAFLFWNHPAWPAQRSDGIARLDDMHREFITKDLLHGIEIVNTGTYSEEAFKIALENNLALIGTSDVHDLIEWDYDAHNNEHRPVTLVFAKKRNEVSIKEALFDRRTVVVFKDRLIGKSEHLLPLLESIISISSNGYRKGTQILKIEILNNSSANMVLENLSEFNFADSDDLISIPKNGKVTLQVKTLEVLNNLDLKFRILNALTAPKQNPVIAFEIGI